MSKKYIFEIPDSRPILKLSKSFLISICIHVSPAHTSKQAMRRRIPNTDVQDEQRLHGPRLQKDKKKTS